MERLFSIQISGETYSTPELHYYYYYYYFYYYSTPEQQLLTYSLPTCLRCIELS